MSPNRATPRLTRDWQIRIWPAPRSRESASVWGQQLLGYSRQSTRRPVLVLREFAACALRSGASGGVVGLRTRKARLRTGGATAIPPADTPPHSSPSTPRRPRLSRARSGGGLPFGLWRRLSEGDGQGPVGWEEDRGRRTAGGRDRGAGGRKGSQPKSYPLSQTSHMTRNMQTGPCLKRNNSNLSPTVFVELPNLLFIAVVGL